MLRVIILTLFLTLFSSAGHAQQAVVDAPSLDRALVDLARQVEPDGQGDIDRLTQYVEFFRAKLANDTRLFAFEVRAQKVADGTVRLIGYVEFPQTRNGLVGFFRALGFEVEDDLELLPDTKLGEEKYGLVKTTHTLVYNGPKEPRGVETDCLLGERLYLLREVDGQLLVHSGEGYLGYVAAKDIHRVDAAAFSRYPTDSAVRMLRRHTLGSGLVLPAGALLKLLPSEGQVFSCALPTGEVVEVPKTVCETTKSREIDIERSITTGKQLMGTPYHWGGKTNEGIDCSGLVQVAFATTGVRIPRDSNQQYLLGQLTATRWHRDDLRRGDTLYFLGPYGRVRHTALYLGDDRYLQAEAPVVNIRSLNPKHDDYQERRAKNFAFGKRLWE